MKKAMAAIVMAGGLLAGATVFALPARDLFPQGGGRSHLSLPASPLNATATAISLNATTPGCSLNATTASPLDAGKRRLL